MISDLKSKHLKANAFAEKFSGMLWRAGGRKRVFLEVRSDGIAWAALGETPHAQWGFADCLPAKRQVVLGKLTREQGWLGASTTLILPLDLYQTFQMEWPEGLDESELASALTWKAKDLIEFSPAAAVSDVFTTPKRSPKARRDQLNLVIAREAMIAELASLVNSCGLKLIKVDIAELALRNLLQLVDVGGRGEAIVHIRESVGQMVIARNGAMYMGRRFDLRVDDFGNERHREAAVQSLALEIQRSLDYYESQLGQVPPDRVCLVAPFENREIACELSTHVGASVEILDWQTLGLQQELDSRCVPAWGAALPVLLDVAEGQAVNLYSEKLRPREDKLQAKTAAVLICFCVLLLLTSISVASYVAKTLEQEAAGLEEKNQRLEHKVAELVARVDSGRQDRKLEEELAGVQDVIAKREYFLATLKASVAPEEKWFSRAMEAFARQAPEKVWLTGFTLISDLDRVIVEGRSQSGDHVALFLEGLGTEALFSGKTFSVFRLSRSSEGPTIEFHVASDPVVGGD